MLQGDATGARQSLLDHLAANPRDIEARALLAQAETKLGHRSAAVSAWEQVVDAGRPNTARRARYEIARLFEDRPQQAIPWLEAYLADPGPLVPEARLRLGRAQAALGLPEAEQTLNRVIADHPGTAAAASARALLGELR